jgi:hypothetical protein
VSCVCAACVRVPCACVRCASVAAVLKTIGIECFWLLKNAATVAGPCMAMASIASTVEMMLPPGTKTALDKFKDQRLHVY